MKVMVLVKASQDSEAGIILSEQLLTDMGNYNEALVKAGILLSADGLHPSAKGARVRFSGANRTVPTDRSQRPRNLLQVSGSGK